MPEVLREPISQESLDRMVKSSDQLDKLLAEFEDLRRLVNDLKKAIFADLGWAKD